MKKKGYWYFGLGLAISIACIVAIFVLIDPASVLEALRRANYRYLLLSVPSIILFLIARALRWRFILNNQPGLSQTFHVQNVGFLLTYLLPFRIGDVARAVLIGSTGALSVPQAITTLAVEYTLDLLFIAVLFPFTLAQVGDLPNWLREGARIAAIIGIVGVVTLLAVTNQRLRIQKGVLSLCHRMPFLNASVLSRRVDRFLNGLGALSRPKDALILCLMTVLVWLPVIFAYYLGSRAVGLTLTPSAAAFVVCVAALSIAAPSSPGQVGVYHFAVTVALAEALSHPRTVAVTFAILFHALTLAITVVAGIVGLRYTRSSFGNVVERTRLFLTKYESTDV